MNVTFVIPDAIVTELNQIAVKVGYANAKLMMTAYLKATIKGDRDATIRKTTPEADTTDVIIS